MKTLYTMHGDRTVATRVHALPLRYLKRGGALKAHARLIYSKSKRCWGNNARQRYLTRRAERRVTLDFLSSLEF